MNLPTQDFDAYVFSKQSGYDEPTFRKEFAKAMARCSEAYSRTISRTAEGTP